MIFINLFFNYLPRQSFTTRKHDMLVTTKSITNVKKFFYDDFCCDKFKVLMILLSSLILFFFLV